MRQPLQRSSSPPAVATNTHDCSAVGVTQLSKVWRDVIASRLGIEDADLRETSPTPSLSSASSVLSSDRDAGEDHKSSDAISRVGSAASRAVAVRMPLSSIAKAEASLHKTVHLSGGGLFAEFTAEDIRRLSDGDVLRCLSTYSSVATEGDGDSNTNPAERQHAPLTTVADIEAHMAALQEEINTFITVVDNEGCSYEIRVGASGHLQVPIDDGDFENGASLHEVERDIEATPAGDATPAASPEEGAARTEGARSAPLFTLSSETTPTKKNSTSQRIRRTPPSKPVRPARSRPHNARVHQFTSPSKSSPPALSSRPRQLSTARPPALTVRPQASLMDSEAQRVEHLLDSSATSSLMTNPYALGAEKEQRLRVLQEEACRYAAVRGAPVANDVFQHLKDGETNVLAAAVIDDNGTTSELGNAYMRYAREHEKMARELRSVNERLRALQQRATALSLALSHDVPSSVAALRPSWAKTTPPVIEESEVQRLLELAREEEARAKEAGLDCALPPAPEESLSGLRRYLGDTRTRAADLLAAYESAPPMLRSPVVAGAEDADDSGPEA